MSTREKQHGASPPAKATPVAEAPAPHGLVDETAGSAETNSLQHLLEDDDGIVFVHSETTERYQCAEVLDAFYSQGRHGRQRVLVNAIELRVVPELNYAERRFALRGLRSLVNVLAELVQRAQRTAHTVILNATGGFKAEAAYATLVGILFKLPVYYIQESFGQIVQLPAFPLDVDMGLIARQDEPNQPKGTMMLAECLARIQYVEEVRGGEFLDTARTRVQREYHEEGTHKIRVIYADGEKGVYLTLTTTAKTAAQNTLVRRQVDDALKG